MISGVLDIHSLSAYTSLTHDKNDEPSRHNSFHSLASTDRNKDITTAEPQTADITDVSWEMKEAKLLRGTEQDSDDYAHAPRESTTTAASKATGEKDWHPLQEETDETRDSTIIVDLGDSIVDSNGRLLFTDNSRHKSSPTPSPRNSHAKASPSPPPWETIQPPSNNGHRDYGGGSKLIRPTQTQRLIPKSSYYFGPPPAGSAFGTMPTGHIGLHHPREVIRVERDYTGGELIQFAPIYPLELEGRITPTQFLESINAINERLIEAHSIRMTTLENVLAVFTLYLSRMVVTPHYKKEMMKLKDLFDELNARLFNPAGLNLLWPGDLAFLFMEVEYY